MVVGIGCIALLSLTSSFSEENPAVSSTMVEFHRLQDDMRKAHALHDTAAYLADSRKFLRLLNGSPDAVLQRMSAEAFCGEEASALSSYEQFVRMGQSSESALQSKTFDKLRELPHFSEIHSAMTKNDVPISTATRVLQMVDADILPEDIDYDSRSKTFYITSVLKRNVVAIDMNGHSRVFAEAPDRWPTMALKVDSRRGRLWVTEVAIAGFDTVSKSDWGRSAVLIYDMRTGRLLQRLEGPSGAAFGDMTLGPNGDAIVSDGDQGAVYRVSFNSQQFERLDDGSFISPQTAVFHPDGRHLFVPDYFRGIGILDIPTKAVVWIPMDGRYALNGIDGLYRSGRTLIATQNGTSPERVVRFQLDLTLQHIESESIIERATDTLGDPTHGVLVNGSFYYIANSGWDALDEHGNRRDGKVMSPAILMRVKLNAGAQ